MREPSRPVFLQPMRAALLLLFLFILPFVTQARRLKPRRLPLPLLEVFHAQHPAATRAVWTADGNGFRVRFSEFGRSVEVTYDQAHQWTVRRRSLFASELPVLADRYLQANHTGCAAEQITLWQQPGEPDRIGVRLTCPGRAGQPEIGFDTQGNLRAGEAGTSTPLPTGGGTNNPH